MAEIKLNPSMSELWYSGLVHDTTINHILGIWGKIFLDSTLVRPGYEDTIFKHNNYGTPHNEHRRAICRAKFNGCVYPGEAWYDYNSFNEVECKRYQGLENLPIPIFCRSDIADNR